MSEEYLKATFNAEGKCFIVPMNEEEIAKHLLMTESLRIALSKPVVSEPLPDDEH